jgi:hypothetical protein
MVSDMIIKVGGNSIKGVVLFRPITKHIFLMNDFPVILRKNSGLAQKMIIVKLNQRFTESVADVFPEDKLSEELPGIFNWALEGLTRVFRHGQSLPSAQMDIERWELLKKKLKFFLKNKIFHVPGKFHQSSEEPRAMDPGAFTTHHGPGCLALGPFFISR